MAKAEWGMKRVCPSCGNRYYDMKKKPPVCPSCGTVYDPEVQVKARRGRGAEKRVAEVAPEKEVDDLVVVDGDEAEEGLIEDAEELADDTIEEVIEVEEDER